MNRLVFPAPFSEALQYTPKFRVYHDFLKKISEFFSEPRLLVSALRCCALISEALYYSTVFETCKQALGAPFGKTRSWP